MEVFTGVKFWFRLLQLTQIVRQQTVHSVEDLYIRNDERVMLMFTVKAEHLLYSRVFLSFKSKYILS